EMALDRISAGRLAIYHILIDVFAVSDALEMGGAQEQFARIVRMMGCYLQGLPSRHFKIDLATGSIEKV
ncbi:hypothetical protein J8J20_24800, partial [Mycobacterium tuberculosis]|nr:hypothetical protein [Mycobacterium tuberculosis]